MAVMKDLTGQKFGQLTAIAPAGKDKHGSYRWQYLCECGNTTIVLSGNLRKGHTVSCGCAWTDWVTKLRGEDLTGKQFARLYVLGRSNGSYWLCRCSCGEVAEVRKDHLLTGMIQSCGCWQKEVCRTHGLSKTAEYRRHLARKRYAAQRQRIPLWADLDAIQQIYVNCPDGYEVDHIIPLQGELVSGLHVQGNLQYLRQKENRRKSNSFTPQIIPTS